MNKIKTFSYDRDELTIHWDDTSESRLQAIWLRDHCQGSECRDPGSGQRLLNITDIPPEIGIGKVLLEDSQLTVEFQPDGHRSVFNLEWLYQNCYCLNSSVDELRQ